MYAEPTPRASGAQAFVAHERGTQTGTHEPTRAKRLDAVDARLQRELEAVAKMGTLAERLIDPDHPLGFIRCKQTAVCYLLRDCPDHGLRREEIAAGLGVSLRTVDYAHEKIRGDEGYVEREHELAAERACRGQLPILRAIVAIVPANDVADDHVAPGGASAASSLRGHPDPSRSSGGTDLKAERIDPPPGDHSARAIFERIAASAREFAPLSEPSTRQPYRPVPVPAAMAAREGAMTARLADDPATLAPETGRALRERLDAATFASVTSGLRHPSCFVDADATDRAVLCLITHTDEEIAKLRRPGGYLVRLVEAALQGKPLDDHGEVKRTKTAERVARKAYAYDAADPATHWVDGSQWHIAGEPRPPLPPDPPVPGVPRTRAEWAQQQLDELAAAKAAREERARAQAEDARLDADRAAFEARIDALERAGILGGYGDPDSS